ncbi:hypothetical protein [Rufibacter roseolus]|uniref:hypothetical protein n=1 Tax=Rufibacter roseolus TaxID=2817375 RepID=UPI001B30DD0A|nr:hypothetical protein [Rufibacter roseolus]
MTIIRVLLFAMAILSFQQINAQKFNKNIDKDSLLQVISKDLPPGKKKELLKMYKKGNQESKEFLLFMFSMPRSSKAELISNLQKNHDNILKLRKEFSGLVPDSLIVYIEFNPKNVIVSTEESIDLRIYKKQTSGRTKLVAEKWNLADRSKDLTETLGILGWDSTTLTKVKTLLSNANCVSLENGEQTVIGFARSGMGKYFYRIFQSNLKEESIPEYNNGCTYLFYKDNIVLEYGGGAIGPQCFPDE